jgi:hypothetical protein
MKSVTSWFVLTAPFLILLTDALVYLLFGYEATITGVVRSWHEKSYLPEVLFLVGCLLLYLHLFRNLP